MEIKPGNFDDNNTEGKRTGHNKMKTYFVRDTHDENGNFRDKFKSYCLMGDTYNYYGLGVHALNRSGELTSFDEYVEEHLNYKRQFEEFRTPTMQELLLDMIEMINIGLVKVVIK